MTTRPPSTSRHLSELARQALEASASVDRLRAQQRTIHEQTDRRLVESRALLDRADVVLRLPPADAPPGSRR